MNATLFLFGAYRFSTDGEHAAALLDACRELGLEVGEMGNQADGGISFLCPALSAKRLAWQCARGEVAVHRSGLLGIPGFFYRHRRRAGGFAGIFLSLCLLYLSRQFVWDVRVAGNAHLSAPLIREALAEAGLGVGSYIPTVDTRQAETRLLLSCDALAWASVTLDGTVVRVQVIEQQQKSQSSPNPNPCNLIADCDGQIEYWELYRGQPVVKVGQAVKKGELLVSGVYEGSMGGYPFTRAAGQVYARTDETFVVKIPLSYTEKVYNGEKTYPTGLKFFNFSFNFCKSTGNEGGTYDIIKVDRSFSPLGNESIPLSLFLTTRRSYTWERAVRTQEEAVDLAYEALDRELAAYLGEARLLEKNISATITEESVTLSCTVTCIRNIAKAQDFTLGE